MAGVVAVDRDGGVFWSGYKITVSMLATCDNREDLSS
jgi:hypothetical protein